MKSQTEKLYALLLDGKPHNTIEIMRVVYGADHLGLARVGARVHDIKKKHNVQIEGWKDRERPSLYWYKMIKTPLTIIEQETKTYFEKQKEPAQQTLL